MKAQVLEAVNKLEYKEVAMPECKNGWVIVKVMAAGVCGSDIPRIFLNGTYHFPTIPGHEFSGIVYQVSDNATDKEKELVGKPVGIFPLIPCKECDNCKEKHYEMCDNYNYLGSRCDGGFAEYVAVPIWNLIELPVGIEYREAAMLEPISVALHGVRQAGVKEKDTVVIYGAGTIGIFMAQWCRAYGAKTLMLGTREEQRKLVHKLGFNKDDFKITDEHDVEWVCERSNGKGANISIECVGNNQTAVNSIMSVRAGGTVLLTGNPKGDIYFNKDVYWRILRKQLHIVGTWNSGYENSQKCDWQEAVNALKVGTIKAKEMITHEITLSDLSDKLLIMKNKTEYTNKVMVVFE